MSVATFLPQIHAEDDPFQKLLEAAWVLQETRAQANSNQLPFDFSTGQSADTDRAPERPTSLQPSLSAHVQPPSASLWQRPQPATLLGSVKLSTDSLSEYGFDVPEPELQAESVTPTPVLDEVAPFTVERDKHAAPLLRLHLNAAQARMLGGLTAVILVVLVYAALRTSSYESANSAALKPTVTSKAIEPAQRNAGLPETTQSAVRSTAARTNLLSASKASKTAENVKIPASADKPLSPELTSHHTVTDLNTQYAVESLSRYEIQTLRRQAKYGDDSAAFIMGMAYETGHYVRQNCKTAAEWVERAAQDGNPAAEYNLGLRYQMGDGVKEDRNLANMWMRKSALKKYAQARSFLSSTSQR